MRGKDQRVKSISYKSKDITKCPLCHHEYQIEQLHSGGGRLIAGKLNAELRRLYDVSKKYGRIYPQAYQIVTCPQCLYSSFPKDFNQLQADEIESLKKATLQRRTGIEKIVGPVDFNENRNLVLGAASYLLAVDCYQHRGMHAAPTPKKGICSLRAAWLFHDMDEEFPKMGFDKIRDFMYTKAVRYYQPTLEIMSTGSEPHEQFINLLGPDTDNNWGFDGVVYLNGYLTNKYLEFVTKDPQEQVKLLDLCKRHLGKLYGMGKASKSKPSVLMDMAKDLYEEISGRLEALTGDPVESEAGA